MTESQTTEYKQTWRDEYLKWVSGFANAEGGMLVIGRDDAGRVVGVKGAKKLLGDHASHPFNPDIANAFFRAGEIESWGRGIQRIFEACQQSGSPAPVLNLSGHDLWTEFPYSSEYLDLIGERLDEEVGEKVGETQVEKLDKKLDEKLDEKLGKNRAKIIRLLRENPKITVTALSEQLEISRNAVHNNIKILDELGWVKRIGPARGGHWEVLK